MGTKWVSGGLLLACLHVACGSSDDLGESRQSVTADDEAASGSDLLPAEAAGTSTESGPGVPDDFGGTVRVSLPLTAEETAAIEKANALHAARNPDAKNTDRGFGKPKDTGGPSKDGQP